MIFYQGCLNEVEPQFSVNRVKVFDWENVSDRAGTIGFWIWQDNLNSIMTIHRLDIDHY